MVGDPLKKHPKLEEPLKGSFQRVPFKGFLLKGPKLGDLLSRSSRDSGEGSLRVPFKGFLLKGYYKGSIRVL